MRVTGELIAAPHRADPAQDRTAEPAGEPFRAALRAADHDTARGPAGDTARDAARDHTDDTMAPAAAQAAYLAREVGALGGQARHRMRTPSEASRLLRAATSADGIDTAAALLARNALGGTAVPATELGASSPRPAGVPGRRDATPPVIDATRGALGSDVAHAAPAINAATATIGASRTATIGAPRTATISAPGAATVAAGGMAIGLPDTATVGAPRIATVGAVATAIGAPGAATVGAAAAASIAAIANGPSSTAAIGAHGTSTAGAAATAATRAAGAGSLGAAVAATIGAPGTATVGAAGAATIAAARVATVGAAGTATIGPPGTPTIDAAGTATISPSGTPTVGASGTATIGTTGSATIGVAGNATIGTPEAAAIGAPDDDDRPTMPPHFPEADLDPATEGMLRAAYGLPAIGAPSTLASASSAASNAASPVDAWLAAAVSRAVGALGTADAHAVPHPGATPSGAAAIDAPSDALRNVGLAAASPAALATGLASAAGAALTPLEQAVRDVITQFADPGPARGRSSRHAIDDAGAELAPFAGFGAPPLAAAHDAPIARAAGHAASASPVQLPEPPANPNHVHLVIDDGPERVVATVAVRGSEVHVALRSSDDATAAALARNAASLDHAMRSRGLDLQDLTAEREPRDRRPQQDAEPRERRPRDAERFQLEEKP